MAAMLWYLHRHRTTEQFTVATLLGNQNIVTPAWDRLQGQPRWSTNTKNIRPGQFTMDPVLNYQYGYLSSIESFRIDQPLRRREEAAPTRFYILHMYWPMSSVWTIEPL